MQTYSSKHSSPKAAYLGLVVFICLFLAAKVSYGFTIPSQCPPPVSPEMAPLIDIPADDWLDEGWYDPTEGYLPENYPGMSWDSFYTDGSSAELVDGKLIAQGSEGTGSLPMLQVAWHRGAGELIRPDGLFIIQVQCRITYTPDGIDTQDETLATVWGSAGDRDCPFSLRYQDGQRVVVLGQVDYCDDPDYVLDYDWSQDTVYTLLVRKGDMLYLEVGPGYWMERSYWEMPDSGDAPEDPDMVGFATGKVDAEYSFVHYCIGRRGCPAGMPPGIYDAISHVQDWVGTGYYYPHQGYFPDEYPDYPWIAEQGNADAIEELVEGRLEVTTIQGALDWGYSRYDELLQDPAAVYVFQVRCAVHDVGCDGDLAAFQVADSQRISSFRLGFEDEMTVVKLGPDAGVVYPHDWEMETTYTLLVVPGDMVYLDVGGAGMISRSYYDLPGSGDEPEIGFSLGSGVKAEYSYVHYCIGLRDQAVYYGQVVDLQPTLPPLEGDHGRMMAEIGNFLPDPVIPGEGANLHISLDALSMPALPSGQFEFAVDTTVDIRTFDPVRTIVVGTPLSGLGLHEYGVPWDGTNDLGQPLEPGVYIYKTTVDFAREKIDGDQIKYFDALESPWRLVIIGPPPGPQ